MKRCRFAVGFQNVKVELSAFLFSGGILRFFLSFAGITVVKGGVFFWGGGVGQRDVGC